MKQYIAIIFLFLFFGSNAQQLTIISPLKLGVDSVLMYKKIDSIVNLAILEKAFPGCQVLAAKNGEIFFNKSYGFHTYDKKIAVKNTDLYDLASVTKITGPLPALMKLVGEGKINLDDKLSHYWFPFRFSDKRNMTIREVLAHQARLYPWIPYWKMLKNKDGNFNKHWVSKTYSKKYPYKADDSIFIGKKFRHKIYKAIRKSDLLPETKYKYSGLAFYIFPKIIEKITGENYETYLTNNFYRPLGAETLGYNPSKNYPLQRIVPTEKDNFFRKKQIQGFVHDEGAATMGGVSGNAGLFSTANDLAKIMQMYLWKGKYNNKQFIDKNTITEFTKIQFPKNENRRGLGFDKPLLKNKENGSCAFSASDKSFGHSGFTGTFTWADPENGLLFVFLSNRVYPTRNNSKIYKLNIRPAIHQVFYEVLKNAKPIK